jgi:hypothetical protein
VAIARFPDLSKRAQKMKSSARFESVIPWCESAGIVAFYLCRVARREDLNEVV